jgi:hypothetical protein
MALVFISYRRDDSAGYAGRLHESLERRLGSDHVFRDVDTLEPGQDFVDAINQRLRECNVLLAIIGREWLDARDVTGRRRLDQENDYVRLEISAALNRSQLLVVPVLTEGMTMPNAEDIPESLRPLTRRHAISLHDETWDSDVDRLVAAITKSPMMWNKHEAAVSTSPAMPIPFWKRYKLAIPVTIAAILLALILFTRDKTPPVQTAGGAGAGTLSPSTGNAYAISVPFVAEISHGDLIYTLISGNVAPVNNSIVRLRIRVSNDGRYDANFADASFRLVVGGKPFSPTSGLNKLVPGNSIDQGIVIFEVPPGVSKASLRIESEGQTGEIPLDLSPSGRPAEDEKADAGDALSKAIMAGIVREPKLLIKDSQLTGTVLRVTTRRFANKLRMAFWLRLSNSGKYPQHSSVLVLRLQNGDETAAPVMEPNDVLEPAADQSVDYVFDLPTSATHVVLRASVRETTAELPFDIR